MYVDWVQMYHSQFKENGHTETGTTPDKIIMTLTVH